MTPTRPPTHLTTRVLSYGSLSAAVILGLGLVLKFAGVPDVALLVGNAGVVVLLLTPAVGLVVTWWELRPARPVHAWLAVAVLFVLLLAAIVSTAARF